MAFSSAALCASFHPHISVLDESGKDVVFNPYETGSPQGLFQGRHTTPEDHSCIYRPMERGSTPIQMGQNARPNTR
ncbi:MAG TPA: hypothetical protein VMC85_14795, partial [Desulfomonilaceae bacterium]|nr:hypothetical protein [Desulfomonilaceae bacterium]